MTKAKAATTSRRASAAQGHRGARVPLAAERSFRARTCHACGEGTIARRNVQGWSLPHRDIPAVEVLTTVMTPCCDQCGEMLLDAVDAAALDAEVDRAYRRQRQATLLEDLRAVLDTHGLRQCDIEAICGLSVGYISKILRDEKAASPLLLRLVHLLRVAPHASIRAIGEVAILPPAAIRLIDPA